MIVQNEKSYVGIDVSKNILDLHILPSNKHMQFKNSVKGINKLIDKLKAFPSILVVMESTGGYEKLAEKHLSQANIPAATMNPRQIRSFARAIGKLAKTDSIDAHIIAVFAQAIKPTPNVSYNENQEDLAQKIARRRQLVEMIGMEKNRLHHANKEVQKSIKEVVKVLEKQLAKTNDEIEKTMRDDAQYCNKHELLQSIAGVGATTSATIIAELPELGSISAKQISALAGLAPFNRDSGTFQGKRTISGGRGNVRKAIYMAALVATRCNKQIKNMYQRLCSVGKPKKVAIVACMRKLLIIMNAMIKNNEPWRCMA